MSDIIYSNVQSKPCCDFNAYSSPCSPYPPGDCPPETQAQEPAYYQCISDSTSAASSATNISSCAAVPTTCGEILNYCS